MEFRWATSFHYSTTRLLRCFAHGFARWSVQIFSYAIENTVDETTRLAATKSFCQLNGFVNRNDGRYVLSIKHFINREAEHIAINCRDTTKFIILTVTADSFVDFGQMLDHALNERLRKLAYPRLGRTKFPEILDFLRGTSSLQISPEMILDRCFSRFPPFTHGN
jgi:hypothetical protein